MTYNKDFDETPVDAEFKQKINVEYLVLKQIDRCNNAALEGDEIKFSNAVESLLAMLPKENRKRIESDKTKEEYVTKIEQPVYKYSCGKPMGTIENPIFRNNKSDWNYQGGEPVLLSPTVEEVEQTDYQKLYKIVLNELQDVGVTWKIEPRGNVEKKIDPPPIPLLKLKNGKFVRILVEKGIEAIQDGIIEDEVEKPETTDVGKDDTGTEPKPNPESESESNGDDENEEDNEEEEGDPDELGNEDGEGETETGSVSGNSNEENEEKEKEDEGETNTNESYDKQLEDAQDENLEIYKQKQKDKKEQEILLRKERLQFEQNKNIVTSTIKSTVEVTKTKDEKNITETKNDKISKEDEKALTKYTIKRNRKSNKNKSVEKLQDKIEEIVDDKM